MFVPGRWSLPTLTRLIKQAPDGCRQSGESPIHFSWVFLRFKSYEQALLGRGSGGWRAPAFNARGYRPIKGSERCGRLRTVSTLPSYLGLGFYLTRCEQAIVRSWTGGRVPQVRRWVPQVHRTVLAANLGK